MYEICNILLRVTKTKLDYAMLCFTQLALSLAKFKKKLNKENAPIRLITKK